MELYIKQRVFSLGDKYDVYDDKQQPVYHVRGEVFSWGAKIHLYDLNDFELYFIQRKVFSFLPEYTIFRGETPCAHIKKQFTLFTPHLTVESDAGDIEIQGNFLDMDYEIVRGGKSMGEIHKKWLSWGDTYRLSIAQAEDAAFFTALAIAVDNCLHNGSRRN